MVELALTPRDQSKAAWPAELPATVEALAAAFDAFVEGVASSPALAGAASAAAKVKAVADAVWGKLQKGYSKDLQHAQVGCACWSRQSAHRTGWGACIGFGAHQHAAFGCGN